MNRKLIKRMGALLLVMMILITPLTNAFAAEPQARLSLEELLSQPEALITRGQFIMLTNSIFTLPSVDYDGENFIDVPEDHPYAEDMLLAKALGYITGNGAGYAFPDAVISGAEAAVLVNNLLGFDAAKVEQADSLPINQWAVPSASVLLDLTMADEGQIAKKQLTVGDALEFISSLGVALMFQGSPYALTQSALQDDFFAYTNRQYLATAMIPTGYMYAASFVDTSVEVESQKQEILAGILSAEDLEQGTDEWKIRELYKMYMDNETRTASLEKVQPYLDEIRAAGTIDELLALAKKYSKYFNLQPFYGIGIDVDAKVDATQWCAFVLPGALDLGAKEYYVEDESLAGIHQAYTDMLAAMLAYMGETDDVQGRADAMFAIEKERASKTLPTEAYTDPNVLYSETSWEEMLELTSTTQSLTHMEEIYELAKDMNIYCPSTDYVSYVESLYKEENLQVLKDFAMFNVLSAFSSMLGDDLSSLSAGLIAAMYGTTGESATLEQRAQSFVSSMMSTAFSRMYAEEYGSEKVKDDVTEIVEDIRAKYRERIMSLTWMSEETKKAAIEKLDAIKTFVAYPDEPIEAVSYEVKAKDDGGSLIDLYLSMADISYDESISRIKQPVEINLWESVPTSTVNAFYSATSNAIIIPAGILQEPFYNPDGTREGNLGGIGAVIAHEFTHAFDNSGAQFDKNGTLTNWWTEEDYAAFNELTGDVAEALSGIEFIGGVYVNGILCTGETVADLGAMECVLDIADDEEGADLATVMEAWSAVWAARMSPEMTAYFLYMDSHAPNKVRVNFVLSQMDDFYVIYSITEQNGMFTPEIERLHIW